MILALFGGLLLCLLAALLVRALFGNAPAGAYAKVRQAKTAPFVFYPSDGAQAYGRGEVDEDPFGRGLPVSNTPAPDTRALSQMDVRFRIPDARMNSVVPPVWHEAGKAMMLPEEMQPWDVGITNVQIIEPRRDGRPPLSEENR